MHHSLSALLLPKLLQNDTGGRLTSGTPSVTCGSRTEGGNLVTDMKATPHSSLDSSCAKHLPCPGKATGDDQAIQSGESTLQGRWAEATGRKTA